MGHYGIYKMYALLALQSYCTVLHSLVLVRRMTLVPYMNYTFVDEAKKARK